MANVLEEEVIDSDSGTLEKKSEGNSPASTDAIVKSIKRRVAPPSPSIAASTPPAFYNSPTFRFFNSEPIFPESFPSTQFGPSSGVAGKESPKLDRKGVSRVPIKMRPSEKDEQDSQDENQDGGEDPEEKRTTTITQNSEDGEPDESVVVEEQPADEQEVSEGSDRSNNNPHYLTRL